jgi:hypothetical protein
VAPLDLQTGRPELAGLRPNCRVAERADGPDDVELKARPEDQEQSINIQPGLGSLTPPTLQ